MSVKVSRSAPRRTDYPGFSATLKLVGTGPRGSRDLSFEEARDALTALLSGDVTPAQAGAFLIATRIKGESAAELAGYAQALRNACVPLQARTPLPLVLCAGAYDGASEAPHLSLAAGAVAAAAGVAVAIHCGPRLGPKYGATPLEVLAELGGASSPSAAHSAAMLERAGLTLVDTSRAVTGWEELLALRNEIGLRGPLHSAEKLIDYFGARRFVVGYTHSPYAARLLGALQLLGAERAIAVRGIEGSDVVRPGRPVAHDASGRIELPEAVGQSLRASGGAAESARLTVAILSGSGRGPERTAVVMSAALRLYAGGAVRDVHDGLDVADRAISSGRALDVLEAVVG